MPDKYTDKQIDALRAAGFVSLEDVEKNYTPEVQDEIEALKRRHAKAADGPISAEPTAWSDLFAEINQAKFDISSPSDDDDLGLTDENMFGG